ncbi:sugar phosphate isomerase/epimerase family protein [Dyadobacter pollutisoli]|uniref:Sugar phosphate isomerase/epimerase n=1 Tax=Dyadobacter pollutisoli TaxID=2910158 RepID=A0A9E8N4H5_9BACT|nr:sugar phosphate isomerase/epimerase [Dyadobacter pollutisoli]WAC09619.1 sugar phosphate isomerase/epimerase [Dyadobacter pollutisoli]
MKKVTKIVYFALGVLMSFESFGQGKPVYTKPIGLQAYTFRGSWDKGIEATLDTIKSLGVTEMEGGPIKGMTTEELRKQLDKRGIKMVSIGADYKMISESTAETIKNCKILGATFVMVPWIPHKGAFDLATAKQAVADFNKVGKELKEAGITFTYHNHGYEFEPYEDGTLFDYLVKNTKPEYVSFEMDVLWTAFPGQDPAKLLLKYPTRWKLMHLKDLRKGVEGNLSGGTPTTNDVALGTGSIDIPAVLKAAKKVGIVHYFIEDESPSYLKQIPQTIAFVKSVKE